MDKEILVALENSEFAEKIIDCISPEEVQECFEEIGISISDTDANKILCSVYGVEEEVAFVNDYDLALCAGGNGDVKEAGNSGIDLHDDILATITEAVGKEKLDQKVGSNKSLYMRYDTSKTDNV